MKVNPLILAVRAIGSEFAGRIYLPLAWGIGGVLFALLLVVGWLTTVNELWWWLLVPIIIGSLLFILIFSAVGAAIHTFRPRQTKSQRKEVNSLVDKFQELSEALYMPKSLLMIRLVQDLISPSKKGFVGQIATHAFTLKPEFQKIIASFK